MTSRLKPPDPIMALRGSQSPISSVSFIKAKSSVGNIKYLVSGNHEGLVSLWDIKVRQKNLCWKAHQSSVLWINCLSSSEIWTMGRSDSVILWDINNSSAEEKLKFAVGNYLGFSQCDTIDIGQKLLIVPGPSQESITLWDVTSSHKIGCFTPKEEKSWGSVMQCRFIKHGSKVYIFVAYENGSLTLWDWCNNKIISSINVNENPISVEFDSTLMRGICGTASAKIFGFYVNQDFAELVLETEFSITNPGLSSIAIRPDDTVYAVGGWDYRIRLFRWKNNKPLAVLFYHKKPIECLAYSETSVDTLGRGCILAAGSSDCNISLWDIYN